MTMPMDFEIEAEPVEASHLVSTTCRGCGLNKALVTPERLDMALCGPCLAIRPVGEIPPNLGFLAALGQGYPPAPPAEREPYPAPVLTSRDEASKELPIPSAVRKLAERAVAASWDVRVQTSMGCVPNAAHGAPGAVKTLHAVVGRKGRRAFNAVHDGLKWKIMVWSDTIPWFPSCSVTDLDQWIKGYDHDQWPAWIEAVRQRVRAAEAAKKARIQAAPTRPKMMEGL